MKDFDIEGYEFENSEWITAYEDSDGHLEIDTGCDIIEITKKDILAMSKYFKITEKDLAT